MIDNAYHWNTNTLIELSPYKFNGKGGLGQKDYVHIAKMPDGIRGEWNYTNKHWVKKYIQQVQNLIDEIYANNKRLSCFIVESILGCGWQIILPPTYLKEELDCNIFLKCKDLSSFSKLRELKDNF